MLRSIPPGSLAGDQPLRCPNALSCTKGSGGAFKRNWTEVQVFHGCHFVFPHLSSLPGYLRPIVSRASALLNEFFGRWVRMMGMLLNRGVENICVHFSWYCMPISIIKEVKLQLFSAISYLPGMHIHLWLWGHGTCAFKFKHMLQQVQLAPGSNQRNKPGKKRLALQNQRTFSLLHGGIWHRIYWCTFNGQF